MENLRIALLIMVQACVTANVIYSVENWNKEGTFERNLVLHQVIWATAVTFIAIARQLDLRAIATNTLLALLMSAMVIIILIYLTKIISSRQFVPVQMLRPVITRVIHVIQFTFVTFYFALQLFFS